MDNRSVVKNIDIDEPIPAKREDAMPEDRGDVVFYCKECNKLVDVNRVGNKYVYTCKVCRTKQVAFGTMASIKKFFHIKADAMKKD